MYFVAFGISLRRSCGLHSVVILLFSLGVQGVEGRMICGAVSFASLVITHSCYFNRCVSHLSCGNSNGKTRIQNRRQCIENFRLNRKLFAVLVLGSLSTAHCMEQQQAMLQQVAALAQAATRAASAAEKVLSGIGEGRSSGLQAASRILKSPDTFDVTDIMGFMSWKQQFSSWLSFVDGRLTEKLERVEKLSSAPSITAYSDEDKEMARKLFAVLGSYLKSWESKGTLRFP